MYQNLSQEFYDSATSKPLYGIPHSAGENGSLDLNSIAKEFAQANERLIRLLSSDISIFFLTILLTCYNEFDTKYKN